jgi:hypothetical protein
MSDKIPWKKRPENREKVLAQKKRHRERYKESLIQKKKEYRELNKEKLKIHNRRWHLKYLYGITLEAYDEMLEKQKNSCAICREITNEPLYIDHCHNSGKIRGLLCNKCNLGVGHFKDNPELMIRASQYILEYGNP